MKNRVQMHTVPVFIAAMGGLLAFGATGIVLGPLVLAVAHRADRRVAAADAAARDRVRRQRQHAALRVQRPPVGRRPALYTTG